MSHGGLGAHYRHNATAATAARSGEPLRPLSNVTAAYSCERRSAIVQVYRLKSLCDCLQSLYHDVAKFRAGCKGKRSVIAANFVCERSRVSSAIARYVAARKTAAARAHPRAPLSLPPFGRCFLQLTRCALEKQARRPTPTFRDSHTQPLLSPKRWPPQAGARWTGIQHMAAAAGLILSVVPPVSVALLAKAMTTKLFEL